MLTIHMNAIIDLAREAGKKILEIYITDFTVENKKDESPLTAADQISHTTIMDGLRQLYPEIPIISEEGKEIAFETRKSWNRFWLVDPLDGTKEFIKKNDEFTVNIALVEGGYPVLGVVYAPALDLLYVGFNQEAYKEEKGIREKLRVRNTPGDVITIVESRSHPSQELEQLAAKIESQYTQVNRIQRGSSLKLCAVADGSADLYPRLGPTMEWDTAAGQAVVEAAGGKVVALDGTRFRYNKETLVNEYFLALCRAE